MTPEDHVRHSLSWIEVAARHLDGPPPPPRPPVKRLIRRIAFAAIRWTVR